MSATCPHCGEPLPAVVDAFCPECRTRLDEVPRPRDPVTDKIRRDLWKDNAILFTLGGVFALLGAAFEFALWLGGGDAQLASGGAVHGTLGLILVVVGGTLSRRR